MYAAFLSVSVAVGTPPLLAALVLGFIGNLFSSLTHYGTGPAPVFLVPATWNLAPGGNWAHSPVS
jgi:uncharacterized membrane protein YjjB (DUF3815 family)